jgi:hypothetical protein
MCAQVADQAWDSMGEEQTRHAAEDLADGRPYAASARYFRAATYHLTGERQTPPGAPKMPVTRRPWEPSPGGGTDAQAYRARRG